MSDQIKGGSVAAETLEKTKAVVKVNPIVDPAYLALRNEVDLLCQSIENMVVDSTEMVNKITADVNLGQKIGNKIEQLRKEYKDPIVKYGKSIDAAFKPLSDPIAQARGVAGQKIRVFNDEQREKQRLIDEENARIAREAAEMQALIDEENAKLLEQQTFDTETGEITGPGLITPEPEPEFIEPAPVIQKASTDFGSASIKKVGRWRVVDFSKVSDDYKVLNEKAINAMVKAGVRNISGLEVWEEDDVSFRSR